MRRKLQALRASNALNCFGAVGLTKGPPMALERASRRILDGEAVSEATWRTVCLAVEAVRRSGSTGVCDTSRVDRGISWPVFINGRRRRPI